MAVSFKITGTQHRPAIMVFTCRRLVLGILMISIAVRPSETVSANLGAPDSNNLNMEFSPDDAVAGGLDTNLDNSNATPLIVSTPPLTTPKARIVQQNTSLTTTTTTTVRPRTIQFIPTPRKMKAKMIPNTTPTTTTSTTPKTKLTDLKTPSPTKTLPIWLDPVVSVHDSGHNPFSEPGHYHSSGPSPNSWPHGAQDGKFPPGDASQGQTQGPSARSRHNFPWWWLLMEEV
ncbi:hypothetical protein BsWGS_00500 [Bradybaena similaris]